MKTGKIIFSVVAISFLLLTGSSAREQDSNRSGVNRNKVVCPGEAIFQDSTCAKCPGCPCIEFSIIYLGMEDGYIKVEAKSQNVSKIYKLLLTQDNQAYLNTRGENSTLLLKVSEDYCIHLRDAQYKKDYPVKWADLLEPVK